MRPSTDTEGKEKSWYPLFIQGTTAFNLGWIDFDFYSKGSIMTLVWTQAMAKYTIPMNNQLSNTRIQYLHLSLFNRFNGSLLLHFKSGITERADYVRMMRREQTTIRRA